MVVFACSVFFVWAFLCVCVFFMIFMILQPIHLPYCVLWTRKWERNRKREQPKYYCTFYIERTTRSDDTRETHTNRFIYLYSFFMYIISYNMCCMFCSLFSLFPCLSLFMSLVCLVFISLNLLSAFAHVYMYI